MKRGAGGYITDMAITNALASLAVRDLDSSSKWYEQLLGPGNQPMVEVIEWQLERGGGLQVYRAPERAGQGSCTLIVSDIDEIAARLRATGLAPDAEPARTERVDTIMIRDPDGNSIAFSMPKDRTLAAHDDRRGSRRDLDSRVASDLARRR
jgi:hypothetical protein